MAEFDHLLVDDRFLSVYGNYSSLGQLWTYMFDVVIWGTVSDWVMIIVTAVTAILLWKTLNAQINVQTLQTKLLKIENERFRSEILPMFDIQIDAPALEIENGEIIFDLGFLSIILNENPALDVTIRISNSGRPLSDEWRLSQTELARKKIPPFKVITITGEFNGTTDSDRYYFSFDIDIVYGDKDGNRYLQQASASFSNFAKGEPRIEVGQPELIDA